MSDTIILNGVEVAIGSPQGCEFITNACRAVENWPKSTS
jgi:hypothetical protein